MDREIDVYSYIHIFIWGVVFLTGYFLQASLGINPAALLPGAAPKVKEPEAKAATFDQPAEVTTLQSAINKVQKSCFNFLRWYYK